MQNSLKIFFENKNKFPKKYKILIKKPKKIPKNAFFQKKTIFFYENLQNR